MNAEEAADRAVLALDQDGRVISWNQAAERILRIGPSTPRGRSWLSLFAQPGPAGSSHALRAAMSSGSHEMHGWRLRMDGSRFWASVTLKPVLDQGSGALGFVAVVRDVTEEKRRADELSGALEISRALLEGRPPGMVLQLVAGRGRALVEGDCALVRTPAPAGDVLVLRATAWRDPVDAQVAAPAREVPRCGSITGWVFDTGRPWLVSGRAKGRRAASRYGHPVRPAASPALYVPLNAGSRTLGTLVVRNWRSRRRFRRQDLDVLQLLADQAAVALHRATVHRERERLAVARERERLGRELHDGAIQSLYAVTLGLAGAIARTADNGLQEQLGGVAGRIDTVIQGLRAHIHQLRRDLSPAPPDETG